MIRINNKSLLVVALMAATTFACSVKQTEEGELPEVDIETEAGNMPEYNVNWADVNVGTRTKTMKVPKVMVVMEEEEVEVPYLDVDMPDSDGDKEERTIRVEAEVAGTMQELDIQEVYAKDNRLYVISTMESTGETLDDKRVRVSDQIVLNAPENLTVRHYIIGEKPEGDFNNNYRFIGSRDEIATDLQGGRSIYSD
jgi:hypothetical protein